MLTPARRATSSRTRPLEPASRINSSAAFRILTRVSLPELLFAGAMVQVWLLQRELPRCARIPRRRRVSRDLVPSSFPGFPRGRAARMLVVGLVEVSQRTEAIAKGIFDRGLTAIDVGKDCLEFRHDIGLFCIEIPCLPRIFFDVEKLWR